MGHSGYLYNNEALATLALGFFMKRNSSVDIAKIFFILPFVLHERSMRKLKNRSYKRSLEEFILKNPECVIDFNNRFYNFLPLTINSIMILKELNIIKLNEHTLEYNKAVSFFPEYNKASIGKRAENILDALDELSELVKNETTNSFYLKMKIEL